MKTLLLSLVLLFISFATTAQPEHFNKIFHPQTKVHVALMKNSPQKKELRFSRDPKTLSADSLLYLTFTKEYNAKGRLIYYHNNVTNKIVKYGYDKKGRVANYFEEIEDAKPILNFAVNYTKKGAVKSIINMDKTKRAQSISYNNNTKTILISDVGGYIYRYTTGKKNRLLQAKVEYYMSTRYNSTLTYDKKGRLFLEKGERERTTTNPRQRNTIEVFSKRYGYKNALLVQFEETLTPKGGTDKGAIVETETFTYKDGRLIKTVHKNSERTAIFEEFYDGYKRLTMVAYKVDGKLKGNYFCVYR